MYVCEKSNVLNIPFRMLNNNKLVTLGKEMLNGLSHLRTLKLADNALACDCHLAWLSRHLRTYPRLGQHTRCASPAHLKDRNLADLQVRLKSRVSSPLEFPLFAKSEKFM